MIVPKVVSVLAFPETMDWQLKEDSLRCAVGEEVVTLQAAGLMEAPPELAPSRFWVQEWRSLLVRGPAPLRVWLRSEPAANLYDDVVSDAFMNQIGRSVIRVQAAGKWLPPLPLEILSTKRPTPLEHLTFYRALLDDLASRATQLPFTVSAPTGIPAGESPRPRPPSPLFVYHFLRQYHDHLIAALTALLAEPHRLLAEEENLVPLAQAAEADADVLLRILTQPEYLIRPTAPPAAMARLRGYAPTHVWQRLGRETFDSPENRFVLAFLRHLLHWNEALQTTQWLWQRVSSAIQGTLRELSAHFRLTLADSLFDEVGEMVVFPAASQVLLRRYGYRELLDLWRLFHQARQPFFDPLQTAIDVRDIAMLYESWCFLALADLVGEVLGASPRWRLNISDEAGLEAQSTVVYPGTPYRLLYNQGFGQRANKSGSYSVLLRPDFALLRDGRIIVAFDAKFRLKTGEWDGEDCDAPERQAKRSDLYKMHTYRDALQVRAAVALYPGDMAEFYDAQAHRRRGDVTLTEIISGEWTGVGALPLSPERSLHR